MSWKYTLGSRDSADLAEDSIAQERLQRPPQDLIHSPLEQVLEVELEIHVAGGGGLPTSPWAEEAEAFRDERNLRTDRPQDLLALLFGVLVPLSARDSDG